MFTKDELPILGILRGIKEEHLESLLQLCIASGLSHIEITMNTPEAPLLIRQFIRMAGKDLVIGAGTVLSLRDMEDALAAGAQFIVSPTVVDDVFPFFPGH